MPFLKTPTGRLFYAKKDDPLSRRPPLILVHGAGVDHLIWPAELRRLPGLRVIVLDLPGHGRSDPPGRRSVAAYAESVRELMEHLDIGRAILAGQSMGGAIAQTMALQMSDRVAGLVLIGTAARLAVNPVILNTILNDPVAVADLFVRWYWAKETGDRLRALGKKQLLAIDPQVTYGDYLACDAFDLTDQLAQITAPTLIIGGEADKMTPFSLSESLAAQISRSTLVKLEGAGHLLHLERPQEVADHITRWLGAQSFTTSIV
jgi:pimeloyl-ACP methyl ester carboxylesterase